jgi:hypothetical protein
VDVFTVDGLGRMELEERICGSKLPAQIDTVHHRVELVFKSDYASSRKGFMGRYEFIDESKLNNIGRFNNYSNLLIT